MCSTYMYMYVYVYVCMCVFFFCFVFLKVYSLFVFLCMCFSLRRSSSSGCWEHRDGWDHISACEVESLLGADFREPGGVAMGGPDVDIFPIRRRTTPSRPALFGGQPDLTPLIDTNFGSLPSSQTLSSSGFDFGGFVEKAYQEHEPSPTLAFPPSPPASQQRRRSLGDQPVLPPELPPQCNGNWDSSVWAMELRGNLIATGRSIGKLEVSEREGFYKENILIYQCD